MSESKKMRLEEDSMSLFYRDFEQVVLDFKNGSVEKAQDEFKRCTRKFPCKPSRVKLKKLIIDLNLHKLLDDVLNHGNDDDDFKRVVEDWVLEMEYDALIGWYSYDAQKTKFSNVTASIYKYWFSPRVTYARKTLYMDLALAIYVCFRGDKSERWKELCKQVKKFPQTIDYVEDTPEHLRKMNEYETNFALPGIEFVYKKND
jgi:hypothetical protein